MDALKAIGRLIATQDNRITEAPIFIVEEKRRIYGVEDDYTNLYDWCHRDGEGIADAILAKRLDVKERAGNSTGRWFKCGYVEVWEFVTACFTEQGCKDFIEADGHNHGELRIYATGSYRNNEYRKVREFLKGLATE